MKKIFILYFALLTLAMTACHNTASTAPPATTGSSPDSASNNGVLPPSSSPDNANNSSLADTAYHKDSLKVKKP